MLLENKNSIIYGVGRAIGGGLAHALAREGARAFLTGHTLAAVDGWEGRTGRSKLSRGASPRNSSRGASVSSACGRKQLVP